MTKEEILNYIKQALKTPAKGANSMGRAEANYNPYYAIGNTFTEEELNLMEKQELDNLIKLAEYLSDAFY